MHPLLSKTKTAAVKDILPLYRLEILLSVEKTSFVGLLTYMFRRIFRQRTPSAFPVRCVPVTCFRRKKMCSMLTAQRPAPNQCIAPCSGISPDSLVQQNKNTCPVKNGVAYLPQKPEQYSIAGVSNSLTIYMIRFPGILSMDYFTSLRRFLYSVENIPT